MNGPERNALDAEQAVIGSLLIDPAAVPVLLGLVDAGDFALEVNRAVFEAARAMAVAGLPVDPVTLVDRLGWSGDAEKRNYLAELITVTPTAANCREYAAILHEQAMLRRMREDAKAILTAGRLEDCRGPYSRMTETLGLGRRVRADSLGRLIVDFGERHGERPKKRYITTGIPTLDGNVFLEAGDLAVIGGAPSDGKTALALNFAYHMAQEHNVGFFSLETNADKLMDRLAACAMGLSFRAIKRQELSVRDWDQFAQACAGASRRRLTVVQASGMSADQICLTARTRQFDVIYIDYGQLIVPDRQIRESRAEQLAAISRTIHAFAQQTATLVVLLLQLNRKERGSNRERDMFDLAESSQFERDADLILLLYRPPSGTRFRPDDKASELLDPETTRVLRIAKAKEGRTDRLPLAFDGDHQRFTLLQENVHSAVRRAGREAREKQTDGGQTFVELPDGLGEEMPF